MRRATRVPVAEAAQRSCCGWHLIVYISSEGREGAWGEAWSCDCLGHSPAEALEMVELNGWGSNLQTWRRSCAKTHLVSPRTSQSRGRGESRLAVAACEGTDMRKLTLVLVTVLSTARSGR